MADQGEPRTVSGRRAKLTRRELLTIVGGTIGMPVFAVLAVIEQQWVFDRMQFAGDAGDRDDRLDATLAGSGQVLLGRLSR